MEEITSGSPSEREIFLAAIDLRDGDREKYLADACKDDVDLRERVLTLLRMAEESGSLPASPVHQLAETSAQTKLTIGSMVGRYKLLELIGEGGMGAVYVAEQTEPMRRKVALKVIKPGMDSKQVIGRFEAERQALALMDHPNIARVLDAGSTDERLPYFVMELVRGMPITEYCDSAKAKLPNRLRLFIDVCHAVQHAHQKGIVHRDLKPSNILVTLHDSTPVVKVIDFGIAKALHQPLTEHSIYTAFHSVMGTPLYMSPEQLELSGLDVDTRSDIYSLGVLLYELLVGTTPVPKERLLKSGIDEFRRIVREEEPPTPSSRLAKMTSEESGERANQRGIDDRQFVRCLEKDLDWITVKTLEKDRDRRYSSAHELAVDVERYLAGEPVLASPPSMLYRSQKVFRKHRAVIVTACLVITLLLGAAIYGIWKTREALLANQSARESDQLARKAVDDMYTSFAERWLSEEGGVSPIQSEFLHKASAFYSKVAEKSSLSSDRVEYYHSRLRVIALNRRNGHLQECEAELLELIARLEEETKSGNGPARYLLLHAYLEIVDLYQNAQSSSAAAKYLKLSCPVADSLYALQSPLADKAASLATDLGRLSKQLYISYMPLEASKYMTDTIELCTRLLDSDSKDWDNRIRMASARRQQMEQLASQETASKEQIDELLVSTLTNLQELLTERPADQNAQIESALVHMLMAERAAETSQVAEANKHFPEAEELFKSLLFHKPSDQKILTQIVRLHFLQYKFAVSRNDSSVADAVSIKGYAAANRLMQLFPDYPIYLSYQHFFNQCMIDAHIRNGDLSKARALAEQFIADSDQRTRHSTASATRLSEWVHCQAVLDRVAILLEEDLFNEALQELSNIDFSCFAAEQGAQYGLDDLNVERCTPLDFAKLYYLFQRPIAYLREVRALCLDDKIRLVRDKELICRDIDAKIKILEQETEKIALAFQRRFLSGQTVGQSIIACFLRLVEESGNPVTANQCAQTSTNLALVKPIVQHFTENSKNLSSNEISQIVSVLANGKVTFRNPHSALKLAQLGFTREDSDKSRSDYAAALYRNGEHKQCLKFCSNYFGVDLERDWVRACALWHLGRKAEGSTFLGPNHTERMESYKTTLRKSQAEGKYSVPTLNQVELCEQEAYDLYGSELAGLLEQPYSPPPPLPLLSHLPKPVFTEETKLKFRRSELSSLASHFTFKRHYELANAVLTELIGTYESIPFRSDRDREHYLQALINRTEARLCLSKFSEALKDFEKAYALAPNDLRICELSLNVNMAIGDFEKAAADLSTLIARNGMVSNYLLQRAYVYYLDGQLTKAADDVQAGIRRTNYSSKFHQFDAHVLRGLIYANGFDDPAQAVADFTTALQSRVPYSYRFPTAFVYAERAKAYRKLGNLDLASKDEAAAEALDKAKDRESTK